MGRQRKLSRIFIFSILLLTALVFGTVYVLAQTPAEPAVIPTIEFANESDVIVPTPLPVYSIILAKDAEFAPPPSSTNFNPARLEIISEDIDIPVRAVALDSAGYVVTPRDAAGYWIASAQLDEFGNIVIVGHNRDVAPPVFRDLLQVKLDSKLTITDQLAREYHFMVRNIQIIQIDGAPASEASRVVDLMMEQPEDNQVVTLVSCYPSNSCSSRIVIRAEETNGSMHNGPRHYLRDGIGRD